MLLNLGLLGGLTRFRSFGSKTGVERSTVITSRKCYVRLPGLIMLDDLVMLDNLIMHDSLTSTTTITIETGEGLLTDIEYSLDGGAWTSDAGVWGTSKYIQVRGTSSADYETALSANLNIGGYNYLFYVTTRAQLPSDFEYIVDGPDYIVDGADSIGDF